MTTKLRELLEEYDATRVLIAELRSDVVEREAAIQSKLQENKSAALKLDRARKRLLELGNEIPPLLHSEISGVCGRLTPAELLKDVLTTASNGNGAS